MHEPRWPLELSAEEFRQLLEATGLRAAAHIESLPLQQAADLEFEAGAELARSLVEPAPEEGTPYEELLELIFGRLAERSFNTASPGYLAYIPGGGLQQAALADVIGNTINRYTGVFAAAPGLVQLETNVIRWFCDAIGYPKTALGFLTSGGSLATLGALVTARQERLGEKFENGTIYVSDQVHHCVTRAVQIAGFRPQNVRVLESDRHFRLAPETVETAVAEDRAKGRDPFLLVGSAGTVNTGAVDPLVQLADLAADSELWFHIDAAYGGYFALTQRGSELLQGLDRADSVVLDPHKGLFLPYGTGALLVRDGGGLKRTYTQGADYLPRLQDDLERVDFCEISPELSKPYRGLRVWLPIKMHGWSAFRDALDEKLDLARWIAQEIADLDDLEIVAPPTLSLLAFRLQRPGASAEEADSSTQKLLEAINRRQRVHLTGTRVRGRFVIRICVLSFRTHRDRMEMCLQDIRSALDELSTSG